MKIKLIFSWILVFIWLIVIYNFSAMNSIDSNNKSKNTINKVIESTITKSNDLKITDKHPSQNRIKMIVEKLNAPLRKCMHLLEYFILAILLLRALKNSNIIGTKQIIITLIFCFVCSLLDEYHQTFVLGRTGQFIDSLIDTFGSIFGTITYVYLKKIIIKIQKNDKFRQKLTN